MLRRQLIGFVNKLLTLAQRHIEPHIAQDLADRFVVLSGIIPLDQRTMALCKDHERVHGPLDVRLCASALELFQRLLVPRSECWPGLEPGLGGAHAVVPSLDDGVEGGHAAGLRLDDASSASTR